MILPDAILAATLTSLESHILCQAFVRDACAARTGKSGGRNVRFSLELPRLVGKTPCRRGRQFVWLGPVVRTIWSDTSKSDCGNNSNGRWDEYQRTTSRNSYIISPRLTG